MINYNDPFEVTEIFRVNKPIFKEPEEKLFDDNEDDDDDMLSGLGKIDKMEITEYSSKTAITWEDIKMIKQYTYKDDWKALKGEKYWITVHNYSQDLLVLGNYKSMFLMWKEFRNRYPVFDNGVA